MLQMRMYIVGFVYYKGVCEVIVDLRIDEVFIFRWELYNQYDCNVVVVYDVCGQMLGYILRQDVFVVVKVFDFKLFVVVKCCVKGIIFVEINWEIKQYEQ